MGGQPWHGTPAANKQAVFEAAAKHLWLPSQVKQAQKLQSSLGESPLF